MASIKTHQLIGSYHELEVGLGGTLFSSGIRPPASPKGPPFGTL